MKLSDAIKKELQPTTTSPEATDSKEFNWSDFNFDSAGANFTGTTQPKWKWSFDGQKLNIWPVEQVHGQPHHIEITGMDFYKLAQGRVYVDPDGHTEILVWEDRGTIQMQDDAINAVDAWLLKKIGKIADEVSFQSEGGYYRTIDPEAGPDMDRLMSTYFGYPVKVKPDGSTVKA